MAQNPDFPKTPYTPATGPQRTGLQTIAGGRTPATILALLSPGKYAAAFYGNVKTFFENVRTFREKLKKYSQWLKKNFEFFFNFSGKK